MQEMLNCWPSSPLKNQCDCGGGVP